MAKKSIDPEVPSDPILPVDPDKTPIYVRSLSVRNVRCFGPEEQVLNFCAEDGRPSQWTVLLGDNGTGKTTLLRCLLSSGRYFVRGRPSVHPTHPVQAMLLHFEYGFSCGDLRRVAQPDGFIVGVETEWNVKLDSRAGNPETGSAMVPIGQMGDGWPQLRLPGKFGAAMPRFFAYGAARGMQGQSVGDDDGASDTLLDGADKLRDPEEWLINLDYAASKDSNARGRQRQRYEQVHQLLIEILPDVEDIRIVVPDDTNPRPRVELKTPDGWIPLHWIGYGYQTLICWMVDLASRMVERYPRHKDPLKQPAVVLVDEIDLHMHPSWQRKLMGYLSERFPNTQFIVTAHSPIFVQAATDANIVVLRRDDQKKCVVIDNSPEVVRGWRVDQLLTSDLFGMKTARPPDVEELLLERKKLLSRAKLTKKDREKVATLETKIGKLPSGYTMEDSKRLELLDRTLDALEQQLEKKR